MFLLFSLLAGIVLFNAIGESSISGGAIGLLLAWVYRLSERIRQLEAHPLQTVQEPVRPVAVATPEADAQPLPKSIPQPIPLPAELHPRTPTPEPSPVSHQPSPPPAGNVLDKALASAWNWLVGGNPFVRAGVVLLFFGVVFLLRYSLEHNLVPVELRLSGAAGGALALLGYGWKLRKRPGSYGLILQAGGVGLLYLTVFGAFSLYHLLPATLALILLVVIVAGAAALAVLQNSLPLAVFATTGGFLAPLLASSGSGNYVGLFSFYAILNAGIVGIAWFRSWRVLNLLGFGFTFVIATLWGWNSYQPENFPTTEPFLIVFFLLYVAVAVLFATRTPVSFKDKVDSTLVFGTPILGFGMQMALVQDFAYGTAISAVVLGAFYLLLSAGLWKRFGKAQQLLVETFLALGVIFTTLAIPFAVDGVLTAAAWAIEGAGILWISIRQQQGLRRAFAVFLHYAALVALLWGMWEHSLPEGAVAFFNGQFLALLLVAGAMLVSSRLLSLDYAGKHRVENLLAVAMLFTGLVCLLLMFEWQILRFDLEGWGVILHLGFAVLVAGLLWLAARFACWKLLRFVLLLPVLLMGLALLGVLADGLRWWAGFGWLGWPLAFAGVYAVLYAYQRRGWFTGWLAGVQVVLPWLLLVLLSHAVWQQMAEHFAPTSAWLVASLPLVGIAVLWWVMRSQRWPVRDYAPVLQSGLLLPLTGLLGWWMLRGLLSPADAAPLPWLPLLNPLDLMTVLAGLTLWTACHSPACSGRAAYAQVMRLTGGGLAFLWLNMQVLRAQHHWNGLEWWIPGLLATPSTQTALAILWALTGLVLTGYGNRAANRGAWMAGAALLGLVVLKLFVVDFASSGTLARIVSFLGVGVLLLFIGYLAPLPPANQPTEKNG